MSKLLLAVLLSVLCLACPSPLFAQPTGLPISRETVNWLLTQVDRLEAIWKRQSEALRDSANLSQLLTRDLEALKTQSETDLAALSLALNESLTKSESLKLSLTECQQSLRESETALRKYAEAAESKIRQAQSDVIIYSAGSLAAGTLIGLLVSFFIH